MFSKDVSIYYNFLERVARKETYLAHESPLYEAYNQL